MLRSTRALALSLLLAAGAASAQVSVPDPAVTGPVTGGLRGTPLMGSLFDLSVYGYIEEEYSLVDGPAPGVECAPCPSGCSSR